jgi:hypothetical protein
MKHGKQGDPPMIFGGYFTGTEGPGRILEFNDVAWRVEQGEQDPANPLLKPKFPWDNSAVCMGHGTVLKDPIDNRFKAWLVSLESGNACNEPFKYRLAHASSDDGVNWERPALDMCPWPGYDGTNIIFDFDSGGPSSYGSVHIDQSANSDEPYEMFCFRRPGIFGKSTCVGGFPDNPAGAGLYRYRSADGLHWRGVEGPLDFATGDTCHIHKAKDGDGYVAHHKGGVFTIPPGIGSGIPNDYAINQGIRIAQRRTSPDGSRWSETIPIMTADWQDAPGDQIMELGYHPYGDGIIGITAIYHAMTQRLDLQFAASIDGLNWWRPEPRQACLPSPPLGDYGSGLIWPSRTLVEDDDRLYLYYGGMQNLHGDFYARAPTEYFDAGGFCRASWEKGRMWAALPSAGGNTGGSMVIFPAAVAGKELYLNARTFGDGEIRAELLDASEEYWPESLQRTQRVPHRTVPGFSQADSIPFTGDEKFGRLAWGDRDLSKPAQPVCLKLYLRRAWLYGFEWA